MDINLFYVDPTEQISDEVQRACRRCPVREDCLEQAIKRNEYGFWGGTTEKDRRAIKRKRAKSRLPSGGRENRSAQRTSSIMY